MDAAAGLLSPRLFSPSSSPSSCSFSPLPSPRPLLSPRSTIHGFFPDLDSSLLSLSDPPPRRSPSPLLVSSYAGSCTSPPPQTERPPPASSNPASFLSSGNIRKTHYSVLGVPPLASRRDIRLAYHKLALLYHPDVSPLHQLDTATKIFSEINDAYATLADPQKRACYDLKLALDSPASVAPSFSTSSASPRKYTDSSTGRVYPSMNSFYREWRKARN